MVTAMIKRLKISKTNITFLGPLNDLLISAFAISCLYLTGNPRLFTNLVILGLWTAFEDRYKHRFRESMLLSTCAFLTLVWHIFHCFGPTLLFFVDLYLKYHGK